MPSGIEAQHVEPSHVKLSHVADGSSADRRIVSFNHLVGAGEKRVRHVEAQRLRGLAAVRRGDPSRILSSAAMSCRTMFQYIYQRLWEGRR